MFGMGLYFKAAALGSGGACKRGRGKEDGSVIYICLHKRSESCKPGAGLKQVMGRVSMETLNNTENTPLARSCTDSGPQMQGFTSRLCTSFPHGLFPSALQLKLKRGVSDRTNKQGVNYIPFPRQ